MEKNKVRCTCGLKIRGKGHYEGDHHKAWERQVSNAVRKCGKK